MRSDDNYFGVIAEAVPVWVATLIFLAITFGIIAQALVAAGG